jgi:DNA-binding response OmpR family regulator
MANDLVLHSVEKTDEKLAMSAALLMQARGRGPIELKALVTSAMIVLSDVAEQFDEDEEPAPRPARRARAAAIESGVSLTGVSVSTKPDSETITFRGSTMEIDGPQARYLSALAKAEGRFVSRERLIEAVYGRTPPKGATSGISSLAKKLEKPLAGIGLQTVTKLKIGTALAEGGR